MTSSVVGRFELRVPFQEHQAAELITKVLPHSEAAWVASGLARKTKGKKSVKLVAAFEDTDGSIVILHSQGECSGHRVVTALDARVEPGDGVPARQAAERLWRRLYEARDLSAKRARPMLVNASVTAIPAQDILQGTPPGFGRTVRRPEFFIPVITGLVSTLVFILTYRALPMSQRPAAWWAWIALAIPGCTSVALAYALRCKERIEWSAV